MTNTTKAIPHAHEFQDQWPEVALEHEELVADDRASLRPSDHVQSKLLSLLRTGAAVPVSCLHTRREVRRAPATA